MEQNEENKVAEKWSLYVAIFRQFPYNKGNYINIKIPASSMK
jgi:hypothetical protein